MEQFQKLRGDRVRILLYWVASINVIFLLIYLMNIIDIQNDKYSYDGIRYAIYLFLLEIPYIILTIFFIVYKTGIRNVLFSFLGCFLHFLIIGIDVSYLPYYGGSVSVILIVASIILVKIESHRHKANI